MSAGLPMAALTNYEIGLVVIRRRVCERGKRKSSMRIKEYYTSFLGIISISKAPPPTEAFLNHFVNRKLCLNMWLTLLFRSELSKNRSIDAMVIGQIKKDDRRLLANDRE